MHPDLGGERRREDGGVQEDPAVLRRHLSSQRAGADRQRPPAAVQPRPGGESQRLRQAPLGCEVSLKAASDQFRRDSESGSVTQQK